MLENKSYSVVGATSLVKAMPSIERTSEKSLSALEEAVHILKNQLEQKDQQIRELNKTIEDLRERDHQNTIDRQHLQDQVSFFEQAPADPDTVVYQITNWSEKQIKKLEKKLKKFRRDKVG